MTLLRWPQLHSLALLLGLSLLLVGCSRLDLVYRNLDWLLPWRLDHYLNLDRQQRAWLKPRLQAHLDWHCSVELPRYLDWLQRTRHLLEQPAPSPAQLRSQFAEIDDALQRIAVQITPTAIALLQMLSAEQVARLFTTLDEDNHAAREDLLEPPLAEQISQRSERMQERLRPWLGPLNPAQQRQIAHWSNRLGEQNRLWLGNRLRWQQALRDALATRHQADFPMRLTRLLLQGERFADADYRKHQADMRQGLAELFSDLLGSADSQQRAQLKQRLRTLSRDLAEQLCAQPNPPVPVPG
jgi:hypothetical protein